MAKFDDLIIERFSDLGWLPDRLWDAMKGHRYDMENVRTYGKYLLQDPSAYLYVMHDKTKKDKVFRGFIWGQVSLFTRAFHVNCVSVDPEYQDGTVIPKVIEFLTKEILDKNPKLRRQLTFTTAHPKAFEKAGCKNVATIMEVQYDEGHKPDSTTIPADESGSDGAAGTTDATAPGPGG